MSLDALGARVRVLRERRGWTQAELGVRCGVVQVQVSKWERGDDLPHLRSVVALADALGTSVDWLARGVPGEPAYEADMRPVAPDEVVRLRRALQGAEERVDYLAGRLRDLRRETLSA